MPKPICHPCQRFFRPVKNGFAFIEGMPKTGNPPPGKEASDQWQPYKLWIGDLWQCSGCGTQIIVGVPSIPIAEHFYPEFERLVEKLSATYQVNDC